VVAHANHRRLAVLAMVTTATPFIGAVATLIAVTTGFAWLILLFGPLLALRLAVTP
jgi:hypothetical protein